MKSTLAIASLALLAACRSTHSVVDVDPDRRGALMETVKGLEGRWVGSSPEMEVVHEIAVTSSGSAVREVMFPGAAHEMTNMYTLDGNSLVMTHYCAGGNQPHMRATAVEDGRIVFRSDGVSDLKAADEVYMGEMTLVILDADHIEEHWKAFRGDTVDHEMVFELERAR